MGDKNFGKINFKLISVNLENSRFWDQIFPKIYE